MTRRDRREWKRLVAECDASGVRPGEFARRRGLSPATFLWWRWKLKSEKTAVPALLPVRVVQERVDASAEAHFTPPQPRLEAALPTGVRLRFTQAAEPAYVAELVSELLARTPC